MRVGLVCPYPWDVPGGVQAHVHDLAGVLVARGHAVGVLAPARSPSSVPRHVFPAGRPVAVPYNGAVARVTLGPSSAIRVRRWLREGDFDLLHVHEPSAPSVGLLASYAAAVPVVATFHASAARARWYTAAWSLLAPAFEKMDARIAVSEAARRTLLETVGVDAVVIPNGLHVAAFAGAAPFPPGPAGSARPGEQVVGFLGRLDEPRKGLAVLVDAMGPLMERRPGLRLLLAGPGDAAPLLGRLPAAVRPRAVALGRVSEQDKARFLASCTVLAAPGTGGESFGIVLVEAMAAGTPLLASDLDGFRAVTGDGTAARLVRRGDVAHARDRLRDLLDDDAERERLAAAGPVAAARFDWDVVARQVLEVYETVRLQAAVSAAGGVPVGRAPGLPGGTPGS